jgi:acetyl-CoA C-acetyltransferase/acetyl-CoA acyltransferase
VNGLVEQDETIRANTTVERLATLESPFRNDELSARFPADRLERYRRQRLADQ